MPSKLYREGRLPYYRGSLLSRLEDETISRIVVRVDLLRRPGQPPGSEQVHAMLINWRQDDDGEVAGVFQFDSTDPFDPHHLQMQVYFHDHPLAQPYVFLRAIQHGNPAWWEHRSPTGLRLGWRGRATAGALNWETLNQGVLLSQYLCRFAGMINQWKPPSERHVAGSFLREGTEKRLNSLIMNTNTELHRLVLGM